MAHRTEKPVFGRAVMRRPTLEELSFVAILLLAAAAFLSRGVIPGGVCLFIAGCAGVVFWTPLRGHLGIPGGRESSVLPLVDRLRFALSEGLALVPRLDPACPTLDVLKTARTRQKATHDTLAAERRDLAGRFLNAADPIEERETQSPSTVNPARLNMEAQTIVLKEIIEELEADR